MLRFQYPVLAFRQQEKAPVQVAFVAHAGEVLTWAGVPRKSDELLTGYQRFRDNKRIDQDIVPFFKNPQNCSPTAVIVALRRDSGVGKCRLESISNIGVGEIKYGALTIEVDEAALETQTVFSAALAYVTQRLAGEAVTDDVTPVVASDMSDASERVEDEEMTDEQNEDEEIGDGDESEEDEPVHLGTATLARMKSLLDDRQNWTNPDFRSAVVDYIKPAFLIDGQHRITAAARIGKNGLPFIVCGLFDAPWEEQVFQFTVVNLKPKRIPPSLITAIAGLSLTSSERDDVQVRLSKAGVKLAEVEIMSLVAYDERSPFYERIDMAVSGPSAKETRIGYGGMKRIAMVWHRATRTSLALIIKELYRARRPDRGRWRDERVWFDFFCVFWNAIREEYSTALWEKSEANHLFTGATLWALQEAVLLQADGQVASHWQIDSEGSSDEEGRIRALSSKLVEVVKTTVHYLPAELWTTPSKKWNSSDTNRGRQELVALLRDLIDDGKAAGGPSRKWRKNKWFTEG